MSKYLLKFKKKDDATDPVRISVKFNYKEFDSMTPLVRFVFENAVFIQDYTIFELKNFEREITIGGEGGSINLSSTTACGAFD